VNTSAIPPLLLPVVLAVAFVAGSRWLLHALEPRRGAGLFEDVKRAMNDPESPVRPPPRPTLPQPAHPLVQRFVSVPRTLRFRFPAAPVEREAELRHPTGREKMGSRTLQTLQ
jgi:hypothetical protein